MRRKLLLVDTSILVELLRIPGEHDHHREIVAQLDKLRSSGVRLHIPVAAVVEAGNHIGRIANGHERRAAAERLRAMIVATVSGEAPWSFNRLEWDEEFLMALVQPALSSVPGLVESLATSHLEMGDLLIVSELARLRANLDSHVVETSLWTRDEALRSVAESS